MSRNARTSTPRGRRRALSFGTAAGAALIAASISTGTAPVAGAVVDADPITDLIGAFDPLAFNASDAPTDFLGLVGYGVDTYLLGPTGLATALDPVVDDWLSSMVPSGGATLVDADPLSDLVGALDPTAFNALVAPDDLLGLLAVGLDNDLLAPLGLSVLVDPVIDSLVGSGTLF
jgi:hypothetical protein